MREGDLQLMSIIIDKAHENWYMSSCIKEADKFNFEDSRFTPVFKKFWFETKNSKASVWMARFYREVYELILQKAPKEQIIAKWNKTKLKDMGRYKSTPSKQYEKNMLAASTLGRREYRKGWLSNSDWKTCK
jgi:hypothetical protein